MIIKIESVVPKLKKDGSQISGQSAKGQWAIWTVNGKYDYFSGAKLCLEVGKSYNGETKTETKDGFTNHSLNIKDMTPIIDVDDYPGTQPRPETYHTGEEAPDFLQPESPEEADRTIIEKLDTIIKKLDYLYKITKEG